MTSDQQRAIEEKIIEGRLIDAIGLYRSATGCDLAEAERAVRARADALTSGSAPSQPSAPPPSASYSSTDSAQAEAMMKSARGIIAPILIVVALAVIVPLVGVGFILFGAFKGVGSAFGTSGAGTVGMIGTALTNPGKLAGGMLVKEPYYPNVVRDVTGDANFRAALGSPINIDQDGITCRTIRNGYTQRNANCTLPVHGPKASGSVIVVVVDQPGSFGVEGQLTTADGHTIVMSQH